jgi:hypothetical protein
MNKRFIKALAVIFTATMLMLLAGCGKSQVVQSGTTWEVTETTKLSSLTIAEGAAIKAPEGYSVTLTVDGVETGQVLESWTAKNYKFLPGAYKGNVVVTVATANPVSRAGGRGGAPEGGMPGAAGAGAREGGMSGAARGEGAGAREGGMPPVAARAGAGAPEGGMPNVAARAGAGAPEGAAPGGRATGAPEGAMAGAAGGRGGRTGGAYDFRQALYLDEKGLDESKSVLAAVKGNKPSGFEISNIEIKSNGSHYESADSPGGTGFTGIYVAGGEYTLKNVRIELLGDGLNDFIGYGAAIVTAGDKTKLVVDNATINNKGVVRAGVIVKDGSKVTVKNSSIQALNGVLPPDDPWGQSGEMRSTLWISGMTGTTRATSILGTNTQATYINSSVASEGWGAMSTDGTNNIHLTGINTKIINTGDQGYGTYNDPAAHVAFYGCEFNVATFASAIGAGDVYYGDSSKESVAGLNEKLGLGLTAEELNAIPEKPTIINSKKHGVMWHRSGNPLTVDGGTTFNTPKTTFIVAGVPAVLTMDGSKGAKINPGNGVIMQVFSDDEPGGSNTMGSADSYDEPTTAPKPIAGFDTTSSEGAATANFSNIDLKGDFYNSVGWGRLTDKLNMVLNLNTSSVTGVISASESHHPSPKITKANQSEFHEISDTARPTVNNGVIVNLTNGSKWIVTGTSYLTSLSIAEDSSVAAAEGSKVEMTVNGVKKEIKPGKYSGKITLTVTKS